MKNRKFLSILLSSILLLTCVFGLIPTYSQGSAESVNRMVLNMAGFSSPLDFTNGAAVSSQSGAKLVRRNTERVLQLTLNGYECIRHNWDRLDITGAQSMAIRIATEGDPIGIVMEVLGNSSGTGFAGVLANNVTLIDMDGNLVSNVINYNQTIPAYFDGWAIVSLTSALWQGGHQFLRDKESSAAMTNPHPSYDQTVTPDNITWSGFMMTPSSAGAKIYIGDIYLTQGVLGVPDMNAHIVYDFNGASSLTVSSHIGSLQSSDIVSDGRGGKAAQFVFDNGKGVHVLSSLGYTSPDWFEFGNKGFALRVQTGSKPVNLRLRLFVNDTVYGATSFYCAEPDSLKLFNLDGTEVSGAVRTNNTYDCDITIPASFTGYYVMEFGNIYVESGNLTQTSSSSTYTPWWSVPNTAYNFDGFSRLDIFTETEAGASLIIDDISYLSDFTGTYNPVLTPQEQLPDIEIYDIDNITAASDLFNINSGSGSEIVQVNNEKMLKYTLNAAQTLIRGWTNLDIVGYQYMSIRIKTGGSSIKLYSETPGGVSGTSRLGILSTEHELVNLDGTKAIIGGSGYLRTIPADFDGWLLIDLTTGIWQGSVPYNRDKHSTDIVYNTVSGVQYQMDPTSMQWNSLALTPQAAGAEIYFGSFMLSNYVEPPAEDLGEYTLYPYTPTTASPPVYTGTNLALNKTASSNSLLAGYSAQGAVDGSTTTVWASDSTTKTPYLQVDLGSSMQVGSVEVVFRQNNPGERTYFEIQLSNDPNFSTYVTIGSHGGTPVVKDWTYLANNPSISTQYRYVRYQRTSMQTHSVIAELRVYNDNKTLPATTPVQAKENGALQIISKATGKALSVVNGGPVIDSYDFLNTQRWILEQVANGQYRIKNSGTGLYLQCNNYALSFGSLNASDNQIWYLDELNAKWYRIVNKTGGVLTTRNDALAIGTELNNNDAERWDLGDAYVEDLSNSNASWMQDGYGIMYHLLPDNYTKDHLDDAVDVERICDQIEEAGASYFVLSLGQNSGYFLAPNDKFSSLVSVDPFGRSTSRDIIMEFALELQTRNIKLVLYSTCLPPTGIKSDWTNMLADEYSSTIPKHNTESAMLWGMVLREWSLRYGTLVSGWWMDGGYSPMNETVEIKTILANSIKAGNPNAAIALNPGIYIAENGSQDDYTAGETDFPFGSDDSSLITDRTKWLTPNNTPVSGDIQWFMLTFLDVGWCHNTGPRQGLYDAALWAEYVKAVLDQNGAICMDVNFNTTTESGYTMKQEMVNILAAIKNNYYGTD